MSHKISMYDALVFSLHKLNLSIKTILFDTQFMVEVARTLFVCIEVSR